MSKRTESYDHKLAQLAAQLRKGNATARQLAGALHCSKPTVYARLLELERRGGKVLRELQRSGSRGPVAVAFGIAAEP